MAILSAIVLLTIGQDVTTQYNCQVGAVPCPTSHRHLTNLDSQAATTLQLVSTISNTPPSPESAQHALVFLFPDFRLHGLYCRFLLSRASHVRLLSFL